jgi:hypothetical protein
MNREQAKMDVISWIVNFVEKPHPALNNWPPCPYARAARVKGQVDVRFGTVPETDLAEFAKGMPEGIDVVTLIYDPVQWELKPFRASWQRAQREVLARVGVYVLEDHPEDIELVNGVTMNQGQYPLLFVQRLDKLDEAADQLARQGYYHGWSEEYLQSVFENRQDPRK